MDANGWTDWVADGDRRSRDPLVPEPASVASSGDIRGRLLVLGGLATFVAVGLLAFARTPVPPPYYNSAPAVLALIPIVMAVALQLLMRAAALNRRFPAALTGLIVMCAVFVVFVLPYFFPGTQGGMWGLSALLGTMIVPIVLPIGALVGWGVNRAVDSWSRRRAQGIVTAHWKTALIAGGLALGLLVPICAPVAIGLNSANRDAFQSAANDQTTDSVREAILARVGAQFVVNGVYRNGAGSYKVWVTNSDYPHAQFLFELTSDGAAPHLADSPGQRNLLVVAMQFSKELDEQLTDWQAAGGKPSIASNVSSQGGHLIISFVEDPQGRVTYGAGEPWLWQNAALFER